MVAVQSTALEGLGNRHLLDKIDKLRELGISKHVPLPQVCKGRPKLKRNQY